VIPEEIITVIREASDIATIAGEHVQLRRSGVELKGRCCFHADRTPSFAVHPGKQVFRCHGCGVGGDIFKFIRLLHKCSFRQAVEFLASRAGMSIDGFKPTPELTAKVAAIKSQREDQLAFRRFCNERVKAINERYRSLERSATHAEDYLRTEDSDLYLHNLAWDALKRFIDFAAEIERAGLCDPDILKSEWEQMRAAA
jgi:DNA primase